MHYHSLRRNYISLTTTTTLLFPRLCGSDVLPMMLHLHFSRSIAILTLVPYPSYPRSTALSKSSLACPYLCCPPLPSSYKRSPNQSSTSFRSTCPNHLNLPRLITSTTPSILSLRLSSTVGTLSLNVTPHIHLNITFSIA